MNLDTTTPARPARHSPWWIVLASLWLASASAPAQAQLRLPSLPSLPQPTLPLPAPVAQPVQRELRAVAELTQSRQRRIDELLRRRSDAIEADPTGQPAVRGEVVVTSPSQALLAAALADGFSILRERVLAALDMRLVVLRIPPGWDTRRALQRLRELDPEGSADYHHLYLDSGDTAPSRPSSRPPAGASSTGAAAPSPIKIGLIDGGVDAAHPVFRGTAVHSWGCDGQKLVSAHGTGVASLLVGRAERFRGAAPDAKLYAADVYCGEATGGSVEAVAAALAWLLGERVPVVNISLVGPANRTLEQVVRRVASRGLLLVAAVGNDGPAAPPLYPAAYAQVVCVTAVDARGQVLPEAGRGPHVAFAAPGLDMALAGIGASGYTSARGTSFAAPLVAGLLAAAMREPDVAAASLALESLARSAADLGAPGRDVIYGHGWVARDLRIEPSAVLANDSARRGVAGR